MLKAKEKREDEKSSQEQTDLVLSENRFRSIIELANDAFIGIDADGNITDWNPQAERIFGWSLVEVVGKSLAEFIMPEKYRILHRAGLARFIATGEPHILNKRIELTALHRDGHEFPIELTVWVTQKQPYQFHSFVHDITERKNFEQSLQEKNVALQKAMDQLQLQTAERLQAEELLAEQNMRTKIAEEYQAKQEEFINTVCHEIRNPLNVIYGAIDLLSDNVNVIDALLKSESNLSMLTNQKLLELFAKCREDLEAMKECSLQQKVIVDDVLDFSRLENNKIELNPLVFNLQKLIYTTLKMVTPQIKEKNLSLQVKMPNEEIWLKADIYRLKQIIINLLSNAIKFTPTGTINIIIDLQPLSSMETMLHVIVEDTGVGMTPDEISHLFNRFSQANRKIAGEYGGSGLGLLICKKLVEKMGGNIQVKSQKWRGSQFSFTVKCAYLTVEEQEQLDKEKAALNYPTPRKRSFEETTALRKTSKNILIVEDNKMNQRILENYLKQKGFYYQIANNGIEAIELFEKFKFDLILMDIEMPVMGGLQATREIRRKEKEGFCETVPKSIPQIAGLSYQPVPGNGHCLYHAVGVYLGKTESELRQYVGDELNKNIDNSDIMNVIIGLLPEKKLPNDYIQNIKDGIEWADNIEIITLMKVFNRPIVIIGPDGKIRNLQDIQQFLTQSPIFIYYNGHNHYDALLLTEGAEGGEVLHALLAPLSTQFNERPQEKGLERMTPIIGLSGNARKEQIDLAKEVGMDDYLTKPFHKEQLYELIEKHTELNSSDKKEEKSAIEFMSPYNNLTLLGQGIYLSSSYLGSEPLENRNDEIESPIKRFGTE